MTPKTCRLDAPKNLPIPCINLINALAPFITFPQFIAIKNAPAIIDNNLIAFSMPPSLFTIVPTTPMTLSIPPLIEDVNLSIAGCSIFTMLCILSNVFRIRLFPSASNNIAFANFVAAFTPLVTH